MATATAPSCTASRPIAAPPIAHRPPPLQVIAQLLGDLPLPWECSLSAATANRTDVLRGPVLSLLHRNPGARPSMHHFHKICENPFAGDAPDARPS